MSRWAPDLIESYARAGRGMEARLALVGFEASVEAFPTAWGRAALGRYRASLGDAYEVGFKAALDAHDRLASGFERARTKLCYGERLRSDGRTIEARRELNQALSIFESLPAPLWADKARAELRACGETVTHSLREGPQRLTPQELQVALIVGRGATNKEAASQLFLSPKTIEHHLSRIYSKLQLRSRTELAHIVARGASPVGAPRDQTSGPGAPLDDSAYT
jgi:DNA-binding CsgD family transcriptional regulator